MIFQSYALWPHMTVAENVAYGLKLRKLPRDDIAKKVAGDSRVPRKLAELAARYPGELSGGQQQRVALARALVVDPETLLLDEPLSNLDANLREEMRFEVRRLHDEYRYTTVYVTHDQSEAMTTADLIAVMNAGKIEQLGSPEDIYARPRSEFVARFIGSSNIVRGKALDAAHIAVAGIPVSCTGAGARGRDATPRFRSASTKSASIPPTPAGERRECPPGRGRAQRLPRQQPRLYGRDRRRHADSRRHLAGGKHRAREARCGCICRRNAAGCWSAEGLPAYWDEGRSRDARRKTFKTHHPQGVRRRRRGRLRRRRCVLRHRSRPPITPA